LHHVEWSIGTESAKVLSVCIFGDINFTMKKKPLHGFEMSLNIFELKLLKISEVLNLHFHHGKSHKSCYLITFDKIMYIHIQY